MAMLPNLSGLNSMNPNRVARQQARMQTQQMVPQRQQAMSSALMGGGGGAPSAWAALPQMQNAPQQPWNSVFGPPPQQASSLGGTYGPAPPQQMGGAISSGPQGNYNSMMGGMMPPSPPNMGQIGGIQASPGAQQAMGNAQAALPTPGLGSTRSGGGLLR